MIMRGSVALVLAMVLQVMAKGATFTITQFDEQPHVYEATVEKFTTGAEFSSSIKVKARNNALYVIDGEKHRIVVHKDGKNTILGGIGNGRGELYYPSDLGVDAQGKLYIDDAGNRRIQVLDAQGTYVSDFLEDPKSIALAANDKGEIFLNQPAEGNLVTAYGIKGNRKKSFGTLLKPSEVYGSKYQSFDESYKIAMNRVWMTLDGDGNIWVSFLHAPVICKFSVDGTLLFKKTLSFQGVEDLKEAVWTSPPPHEYASVNFDGVQLTLVTKDITYDSVNKRMLVLVGSDHILALDTEGNLRRLIKVKMKSGTLWSMAVGGKSDIFLSIMFSNKLYKLVYSKSQKERR